MTHIKQARVVKRLNLLYIVAPLDGGTTNNAMSQSASSERSPLAYESQNQSAVQSSAFRRWNYKQSHEPASSERPPGI